MLVHAKVKYPDDNNADCVLEKVVGKGTFKPFFDNTSLNPENFKRLSGLS